MFDKILLCLDGSELAEQILPYAREQARLFRSHVALIHVVPTPVITPPDIAGAPEQTSQAAHLLEEMQQDIVKGKEYLRNIAVPFEKSGLTVDSVILEGAAGEQILEYAESNKVKLIAIATHGRSGLGRAMFGSVADFLLRQSGIPLLVVRPVHK